MKHLMFAIVMLAAACGGKKDEPTATTASGSAAAGSGSAAAGSGSAAAGSGSAAGSAAEPAAAEVDVPTEVDFEDEVATKITEKTLDTELKALEAELE